MQGGISGRVSAELRSDAVKMVFVKEESKENTFNHGFATITIVSP